MMPFMALLGVGIVLGAFGSEAAGLVLVALGGGGLLAVLAVQTAMDQVFRVFVYRSALGIDDGVGPFAPDDLERPFGPRRGWLGSTG